MPSGESLDDDYVAALLLKDAETSKKWYGSGNGIGSLDSKSKRRADAPKPNTTFLRNIIRDTDSHNAALKAKEEQESRARLRGLRNDGTGRKRKRDGDDDRGGDERKKKVGEKSGRWMDAFGGLGIDSRSRRSGREERRERSEERQSRDRHRSRRKRSRSREHRNHGGDHRLKHERQHDHRSRSPAPRHRKEHRRRHRADSQSPPSRDDNDLEEHRDSRGHDSESDPLEELLGPKPPPKVLPRGRGALKASNMDTRFRPDYDPKADVSADSDLERDDWDMALEAVRDRAKWRTQGADRLRAAGFTEAEVDKWAKGGEKDVEDVKWRKKGESREWDRGKVMEDNELRLKPDW